MTPVNFIVYFALFFCFGSTLSDGLLTRCPDQSQLLPCTCRNTARLGVWLQCVDATVKDVKHAVGLLKDHDILGFSWFDYNGPLFANLFKGMHVYAILLNRVRLHLEPPDTLLFEELQSTLKVLEFNNSQVGFPQIPLKHLSNLEELWIEHCMVKVTTLKVEWVLQWPANLIGLRIDNCDMETLEYNIFTSLKKLQYLSLRSNRIVYFDRSMLAYPLNDLFSIDFSYNRLTKLNEDFFDGMPHIMRVHLTGNQFKSMLSPTWLSVWDHVAYVYLDNNPLDCSHPEFVKWVCLKRPPRFFTATCKYPVEIDVESKAFCSEVKP